MRDSARWRARKSAISGAAIPTLPGMGRPRVHDEPRVTTAVRVPKTLHERVRDAADERGVGVNTLVVRALEEYLDRLVPVDEVLRTRDTDGATP
jgi:hypothetical protein